MAVKKLLTLDLKENSKNKININSLKSGIYFLNISSNTTTTTIKFVIY